MPDMDMPDMNDTTDNKNDSSLKEFLSESEEITEALNNELMVLAKCAESGERVDPGILNSIFRSAHSLKGLSGMFGFEPMVALSHNLEELLDAMRLGKVDFSMEVADALFESLSVVSMLLEAKSRDSEVDDSIIKEITGKLSDALSRKKSSEESSILDGIDAQVLDVLTEYEEHRLTESLKEGLSVFKVQASFPIVTFDQALEELSAILKAKGEIITTLPTPGATPGETINFDLVVATKTSKEDLEEAIDDKDILVSYAKSGAAGAGAPETSEVETTAEPPPSALPTDDAIKSITQTVRVDIAKLDELMNLVGELVLIKGAINSVAASMKTKAEASSFAVDLQKSCKGLDKMLSALQQGIMEARMVPLGQIFDKLARTIRKIGREVGKEVTLDVSGGETRLDKLIVEELTSPLMHIIRNSMDHGIEDPEGRRSAGKPEKGTIRLDAFQSGSHVVLKITDDGRGIDPDKILKKAVEKGLAQEGTKLRKEELLNLMFTPGFSTSEEVSELSGRGVGMDVVKSNISGISGMVEMESTPGKGTTVILTLPMTLAIIQALIIKLGSNYFAVPLNTVLESFLLEDTQVETIETKEFVHLRNSTVPIVRLGSILGVEASKEGKYVVIVGLAEKKLGLVVDDIEGQQDIVIKTVGKRFSEVGIIGGATEYREKTILTIDVGGIIEECMGEQAGLRLTGS